MYKDTQQEKRNQATVGIIAVIMLIISLAFASLYFYGKSLLSESVATENASESPSEEELPSSDTLDAIEQDLETIGDIDSFGAELETELNAEFAQ